MLREAFSRIIALQQLTVEAITRELNETLRRKEEARIYNWHQQAGQFPPRCARAACFAHRALHGGRNKPPSLNLTPTVELATLRRSVLSFDASAKRR